MASVSGWWQRKRFDSRNTGMQQEWKCSGICALQTKERSRYKSFPTREIRGRVGLCVLDAHARVFHCLHSSMLFLPLVWIMRFLSWCLWTVFNCTFTGFWSKRASSHHCFQHHCSASSFRESFAYCKAPDVSHSSTEERSWVQTCRAKSPKGCGEGSEQQWPKQRCEIV